MVDSGTGDLLAITGPFRPGEAFVSVPSDSDSLTRTLGLLNLDTGNITAFATGLGNPKGLLFVDHSHADDSE